MSKSNSDLEQAIARLVELEKQAINLGLELATTEKHVREARYEVNRLRRLEEENDRHR